MSKKLTINQLITDPSFVNWAKNANSKDVAKWEAFLQANPEQSTLLFEAKMMVSGFEFKKTQVSENQVNKSWDSFASKLEQSAPEKTKVLPLRRKLLRIAAVFLVLVASIWAFQQFQSAPELIVFETDKIETQKFKLPDGSEVFLNTNSKLSFYDNWLKEDIRNIQLEGEAYFEVKKQPEGKLFQVESEQLTVNVVGTAFNFNAKRKSPIVSLVEGTVVLEKINIAQKILKEGQTAWFNPTSNQFEIQGDQTNYWKAWTTQKWIFNNSTSVNEVLTRIEETFGLKTRLTDEAILQKEVFGEVSIESPEVLFEALSYLLDVEMKMENGELIISPNE